MNMKHYGQQSLMTQNEVMDRMFLKIQDRLEQKMKNDKGF